MSANDSGEKKRMMSIEVTQEIIEKHQHGVLCLYLFLPRSLFPPLPSTSVCGLKLKPQTSVSKERTLNKTYSFYFTYIFMHW